MHDFFILLNFNECWSFSYKNELYIIIHMEHAYYIRIFILIQCYIFHPSKILETYMYIYVRTYQNMS